MKDSTAEKRRVDPFRLRQPSPDRSKTLSQIERLVCPQIAPVSPEWILPLFSVVWQMH